MNEVKIHVVADDDVDGGFAAARAKSKKLGDDVADDMKKSGKKAGDNIGEGMLSGISDAIPSLSEVAGPAAVVLAPLIGAAVSAGVIGGAGIGGVLGGVMLAAKDPRVAAAGAELKQNIMGQLQADAAPFIGPVLQNIGKIEVAFTGMNSRIKSIFASSAGFLDPLVNGAINGVEGVLKGVQDLTSKGKPVIDAFGQSFEQIGKATGKAMSVIAGGSKSASLAVKDLTDDISGLVIGAGYLIRGLTELYRIVSAPQRAEMNWITKTFTGLNESQMAMAKTSVSAAIASTASAALAKTVLSAGEAAGQAGQQMETFAEKMDDAAAKGKTLYDSQTDVAQAIADTGKKIADNGKTLDINTQKGRDNRRALSDVAAALVSNYNAYVKVNGEGAASQGVAQRNRDAFIRLAEKAGLAAGKASDLATELGLIPAKKSTDFYANTHDAAGRIAALQDQVNGVHGKTINVRVSVTGTERLDALGHRIGGYAHGGVKGAATGGPQGGLTWTGENGPELLDLPPGTAVHTSGDSRRMMAQSGGGGGIAVIGFDKSSLTGLAAALMQTLRVEIRAQGGNVQQVLGVPGR